MTDWRFDDSDDSEFDEGFDSFIKVRNIKTYKKGGPSPLVTGSNSPWDIAQEQAGPDGSGQT